MSLCAKNWRESVKRDKGHTLPDDFELAGDDIAFFTARNPRKNWREQFERFRFYHQARGTRFVNWNAAWRTWSMNAAKFEPDGFDETKLKHPLFVPPNRA